jgi:hypothetical protein
VPIVNAYDQLGTTGAMCPWLIHARTSLLKTPHFDLWKTLKSLSIMGDYITLAPAPGNPDLLDVETPPSNVAPQSSRFAIGLRFWRS